MKKLIFSSLALLPLCAMAQDSASVTLKGTVKGAAAGAYVYVAQPARGKVTTDSAVIDKKGAFTVPFKVAEPKLVTVYIQTPGGITRNSLNVFVEPGTITLTVKDSVSNATVKGSESHAIYAATEAASKDQMKEMDAIRGEAMKLGDAATAEQMEALRGKYMAIYEKVQEKQSAVIKANPNAYVSLYYLSQQIGGAVDYDKVNPTFSALSERVRNTATGKRLAKSLETAEKTSIGKQAMEFTQKDQNDKDVTLASFRGKYVLIDFWASWCGPCRAENPNVVKAYNAFKDKGFTILGVSLDRDKDKWIKAIADDQLAWSHVSDLQYWNNAVAVQYGIQSVPSNLLIDPQGKIVAKNLRGEDLAKKLEELIKG